MVAIFAGLLLAASFEPIGWWVLAPLAFALFFWGLKRTRYPVIYSFVFGLVSNALILQWSGKYVGVIPWLALTTLQGLFYLPLGFFYRRFQSLPLLIPVILILEEIRARFPFKGFGWTRIAFSQSDAPYIHLVSIGGVLLVSLVVLFAAVVIQRISLKNLTLIILVFLAPLLIVHPISQGESISVIGIQGNTPQVGIGFNDRAMAVFDLHARETLRQVSGKFDLIVWPENAVDVDPFNNTQVGREISRLARTYETPMIVGAVLNSRGALENTSILYEDSGEISTVYVKRHLTPFGEYMPLRTIAEALSPYASLVNDFSPGQARVTHQVKGFRLGPIICYELINDGLVRDMARHSQALIVQTNSATFAGTSEGSQQLDITRIRSIEHARDILSVSTVGPSALISYRGEIVTESSENAPAAVRGSLSMRSNRTVADRLGGVAPLLVISLSILIALRMRKNFT